MSVTWFKFRKILPSGPQCWQYDFTFDDPKFIEDIISSDVDYDESTIVKFEHSVIDKPPALIIDKLKQRYEEQMQNASEMLQMLEHTLYDT
jgi:hypothetical protein